MVHYRQAVADAIPPRRSRTSPRTGPKPASLNGANGDCSRHRRLAGPVPMISAIRGYRIYKAPSRKSRRTSRCTCPIEGRWPVPPRRSDSHAAFLLPRISSRMTCRRVSARSAWCTDKSRHASLTLPRAECCQPGDEKEGRCLERRVAIGLRADYARRPRSARAGYSEDLQHGQALDSLRVVNPFS